MGTIREIVASNDKELMPPPPSQSVSNKKGVIASPGLGLKDTIQVGELCQVQGLAIRWVPRLRECGGKARQKQEQNSPNLGPTF